MAIIARSYTPKPLKDIEDYSTLSDFIKAHIDNVGITFKINKDKFMFKESDCKYINDYIDALYIYDFITTDWKPDFNNAQENKYFIIFKNNDLNIINSPLEKLNYFVFPNKLMAEKFINILNLYNISTILK